METWIYVALDPRPGMRNAYVGKTTLGEDRFRAHEKEALTQRRTAKQRWIAELLDAGLRPRWGVLEIVAEGTSWQERERWWIAHFKGMGYRVCNLTRGGDGWGITATEWGSPAYADVRERHARSTREAMAREAAVVATCDVCGRSFQGQSRLHYHQTRKHSERRLQTHVCEMCGRECEGKSGLTLHSRAHSPESEARRLKREESRQRKAERERARQARAEADAARRWGHEVYHDHVAALREDRQRFPVNRSEAVQRGQETRWLQREREVRRIARESFMSSLCEQGTDAARAQEIALEIWPDVLS